MISVEGDFVRTWWYGRRRIRHKARKYRRFGGVRIILGWHNGKNSDDKTSESTESASETESNKEQESSGEAHSDDGASD